MRCDQSESSSNNHLSMSNTSQSHYALQSRSRVEPRHERSKPNKLPGQTSGLLKTYNSNGEPTLGAEEPDNTQSRQKNHNETSAHVNEARCFTPKALDDDLQPLVHSPTATGDTDQQTYCPIDDVSLDTQVHALKIATTAPHVWSFESMGSHLDSQNIGYVGPLSPGTVSGDELLISDTETSDGVSFSFTASVRRSCYQADHYADIWL